jgi:FecR protein
MPRKAPAATADRRRRHAEVAYVSMIRPRLMRMPGRAWVAAFGGLLVVAAVASAHAQPRSGSAELKNLTGRVELLRKGQTEWAAAVVGARLVEGDDVRTYAGASVELALPDGSTLVLAENSRLVVSKLDFDAQDQTRLAAFHLAVGKVRALVSRAAVSLVRSRQSNFVISTPTAVAAARGTDFEVVYNWFKKLMEVGVLAKGPKGGPGIVICESFEDRFSKVTVREGLGTIAGTEGCGPPVKVEDLGDPFIGTLQNPIAPGSAFGGPITVPPFFELPGIVTGPPVVFTAPSDVPSTIGLDTLSRPTNP